MIGHIRSVIIDDEQSNIDKLTELLAEYCPHVSVENSAATAEEARTAISQARPDLVFFDIELPGTNAFEILNNITPANYAVIFVTAYEKHAARAFRYDALDFIVKPINPLDLIDAVGKLGRTEIRTKPMISKGSLGLLAGDANDKSIKISLPTSEGIVIEKLSSITHLSASGSYTTVHLTHNRRHIISKNLRTFETVLPDTLFVRVHNSYMVNISHISHLTSGRGGNLYLSDGTAVSVATRRKTDFIENYLAKRKPVTNQPASNTNQSSGEKSKQTKKE